MQAWVQIPVPHKTGKTGGAPETQRHSQPQRPYLSRGRAGKDRAGTPLVEGGKPAAARPGSHSSRQRPILHHLRDGLGLPSFQASCCLSGIESHWSWCARSLRLICCPGKLPITSPLLLSFLIQTINYPHATHRWCQIPRRTGSKSCAELRFSFPPAPLPQSEGRLQLGSDPNSRLTSRKAVA